MPSMEQWPCTQNGVSLVLDPAMEHSHGGCEGGEASRRAGVTVDSVTTSIHGALSADQTFVFNGSTSLRLMIAAKVRMAQ